MNGFWSAFFLAFAATVIVLLLLPPKWDPAIRLHEWLEQRRIRREWDEEERK